MISVRIDSRQEEELRRVAESKGITKSEYIRSMIIEKLDQERQKSATPWELGKDVFGRNGSGKGNLSQDRKKLLKDKIRAKKSRH